MDQLDFSSAKKDEGFGMTLNNIKRWTDAALMIQSRWRGHKQRREFYALIMDYVNKTRPISRTQVSNESIMKQAFAAVSHRNLTLEHCFRAADIDEDGIVLYDDFLQFLRRLNLGLSQAQFSRLLLILDEDCSGKIERQEFFNSLAAYGVATEHHRTSARTYQQEVLVKFARVLDAREISSEDVFRMCDKDESNSVSVNELEKFVEGIGLGFQSKEVHALMTILDVDRSGHISREEFMKHLQKGTQAFKVESMVATHSAAPPVRHEEGNKNDKVAEIVKKMESKGTKISEAFALMNLGTGKATISQVSRELGKFYGHIGREDILTLLTHVDIDKNSMIDVNELQSFLTAHSPQDKISIREVIARIAGDLDARGIPTTQFCTEKGIVGTLQKNQFVNIVSSSFNVESEYVEQLFHYLDLDGLGEIKDKDFIAVLQTYRNESFQRDALPIMKSSDPIATVKEFLELLGKSRLTVQNIFKLADKTGSHEITPTDFELAVKKIITDVTEDLLARVKELLEAKNPSSLSMEDVESVFDLSQFSSQKPSPSKPVQKPAEKPAVKPAEKPIVKPVEKPVAKRIEEPIEEPASRPMPSSIQKQPEEPQVQAPANSFEGIIQRRPRNVPLVDFLSEYSLQPNYVYNLERFSIVAAKLGVEEGVSSFFYQLDTHKKGVLYGYVIIMMLDSYSQDLTGLPMPQSSSNSAIVQELKRLAQRIHPKIPLYTQLPDLSSRVEWPPKIMTSLPQKALADLRGLLPEELYYYHLAALIQSYLPDVVICPRQILYCFADLNNLSNPSGELFATQNINVKMSGDDFSSILSQSLSLKSHEVSVLYQELSIESEIHFCDFLSFFDMVISTFSNGKLMHDFPSLPYSKDKSVSGEIVGFYRQLSGESVLDSYNPNSYIGIEELASRLEQVLRIDRSLSVPALSLLQLNRMKPRFYHLLSVVSSYTPATAQPPPSSSPPPSAKKDSARSGVPDSLSQSELILIELCKTIPGNMQTSVYFQKFPINRCIDSSNFYKLMKLTFNCSQEQSDLLLKIVDPTHKEAIYAVTLFTWVDIYRSPVLNQGRPVKVHQIPVQGSGGFQKFASRLDQEELPTADYFYQKGVKLDIQVSPKDLGNILDELSPPEVQEMFEHANIFTQAQIPLYHLLAIVENYRTVSVRSTMNGPVSARPAQPVEETKVSEPVAASRPPEETKQRVEQLKRPAIVKRDGLNLNENDPKSSAVKQIQQYIQAKKNTPQAIETVFSKLDEKGTQTVNEMEFGIAIDRLRLSIDSKTKSWLFTVADTQKDGDAPYLEFIGLIEGATFTSAPEVPASGSAYLESVRAYQLSDSDYFCTTDRPCTTMLNSEIAALKKALEFVSSSGGGQFRDPDFGGSQPNNGARCLYWRGKPPSSNFPPAEELEWKSPSEWLPDVCFFDETISSNDVIQGSLGDCWFIGALSVLATRDDKLRGSILNLKEPRQIDRETAGGLSIGVYPPIFHPFARKGLYVLRFFKDCGWRYVIIDEQVPVYVSEGRPPQYVFGHCRNNSEMWVALIEKAYSKLHGCYESLNGGLIDDGLVDMTGHVAEKFKLKGKGSVLDGPAEVAKQKADDLWERLKGYRNNMTLMGCSIDAEGVESDVIVDGEVTGLLARHAYGLVDVLHVQNPQAKKTRHRLLRVRNPWGDREWMGKWSDKSEKLMKNLDKVKKQIERLGADEQFDPENSNDGNFLMCFKDWRSLYDNFFACVDFPDHWWGIRFASEWTSTNSGGVPTTPNREHAERWANNPQFILDIRAKTEMFATLMQEDGRHVPESVFPYENQINTACFAIMTLKSGQQRCPMFDQGSIVKLSVLKSHREVHLRIDLPPGRYSIVPSTMHPGKVGKFWLSMYFSVDKSLITAQCAEDPNKVAEIIQEEEERGTGDITEELIQDRRALVSALISI